jgi:hypothetical protein
LRISVQSVLRDAVRSCPSPLASRHGLGATTACSGRVGFWTVLTGLTLLTGLTADVVDLVDSVHSVRCQHSQSSQKTNDGFFHFINHQSSIINHQSTINNQQSIAGKNSRTLPGFF